MRFIRSLWVKMRSTMLRFDNGDLLRHPCIMRSNVVYSQLWVLYQQMGRSFNHVTYGPANHVAVRNTWKLWWLRDIVISIIDMNFSRIRSVCQKLLKVQVGSVTYTCNITVHKKTTEKKLWNKGLQGHVGLDISASHLYSELCQIHLTSVVSKSKVFI